VRGLAYRVVVWGVGLMVDGLCLMVNGLWLVAGFRVRGSSGLPAWYPCIASGTAAGG